MSRSTPANAQAAEVPLLRHFEMTAHPNAGALGFVLLLLVHCCWQPVGCAQHVDSAQQRESQRETPFQASTLRKQFDAALLPRVLFRGANFDGALQYVAAAARKHSAGRMSLSFISEVPEDFQPRHELSLDLNGVPLSEVIRYLAELAGVEFAVRGNTLVAKLPNAAPTVSSTSAPRERPVSNSAPPVRTDALSKPAQQANGGSGIHRRMNGQVQMEKTGHIRHRSMGGWNVLQDPLNKRPLDDK